MKLNTTDLSQGVTIENDVNSNPTHIVIANPGTYDIQFSAQITKSSASAAYIWIWLNKNGSAVA